MSTDAGTPNVRPRWGGYSYSSPERGQIAPLLAMLVIGALAGGLVLVTLADAMSHRARARTAADAVALAGAVDGDAADQLRQWYRGSGVEFEQRQGGVIAFSGPSQAASWATAQAEDEQAPAVVAIMARARQLLGIELAPLRWTAIGVRLNQNDTTAFTPIASELGMCAVEPSGVEPDVGHFELC